MKRPAKTWSGGIHTVWTQKHHNRKTSNIRKEVLNYTNFCSIIFLADLCQYSDYTSYPKY